MLWAFEPVKYCSAAPQLAGGTTRRSAFKPPRNRTLAFVSPRPITSSTSSWPHRASSAGEPSSAAQSRSTSLVVSRPRRRLPARLTWITPETSASIATSGSATFSATAA